MAPKRQSPLDNPPAASSPAEESESGSGSGSEYETDSDEECQQTQPPKPTSVVEAAPPKKPAVAEKKADGGSESESESDSEEVAAKGTSSKQQQPPKSPAKSPPAKASGSKRSVETEPKPKPKPKPKRPKKDSDPAPAPAPAPAPVQNKPLFQRVWSEADEIAILEGMIAYTANTGLSPNSNLPDFLDYIKKFLKFDVSLPQLKNKMARLKKRHQTCVAKEKKGQKPVNRDKPHEAKVFDLLVKMWGATGSGSGGQGSTGSNGGLPPKKKKKKADLGLKPCASSDIVLDKCLGVMGISEALVKEGLELIGAPKQAEMKEEWGRLRIAELELYVRRTQLMREQTTVILDAVKSSQH